MGNDTRGWYDRAVRQAVADVVAHLDDAVDLDALAHRAATSTFHFHRIFRAMAGETPLALSRRLRLERAAHQLSTTDKPVTSIAFDAGYDSHEAFTRAFRTAFAASPTAFRRQARQPIELAAPNGVHYRPGGHTPFSPIHQEDPDMDITVDLVEQPPRRLATVTHTGPYNQIGTAFEQLGRIAGPAGLFAPTASGPPTAPEMIAIYLDDPEVVPADQLRALAGLTITDDRELPAGLQEWQLPGGRYAHTLHRGSYELLGDTWARLLGGWLPRRNLRIGPGSMFELYRNTPADADPADLVTELYVPIIDEPATGTDG